MYPQCRPASPLWSYSAVRFLAAGSIVAISFFRLTYTLLWSTSKELQVFSAKSEVVPNFASVQSKMSPMFKDNITHLAERAAANELIIADMLSQMARLAAAPLEVDPRHFYNSPSAMRHKEREGCSTVQPWGRLQPQPHTYSSPAPPSSVCQRQPARPITEELLLTFRQEKGYAPRFRLTFDGKLYAMYPNNSHLYNQPVDPVPSKKSSTSLQRGSSASAGHSLGGSYQWPYWRHSLSEVVRYGPGNARFRVATALASLLRGVCSDPDGNFLHFAPTEIRRGQKLQNNKKPSVIRAPINRSKNTVTNGVDFLLWPYDNGGDVPYPAFGISRPRRSPYIATIPKTFLWPFDHSNEAACPVTPEAQRRVGQIRKHRSKDMHGIRRRNRIRNSNENEKQDDEVTVQMEEGRAPPRKERKEKAASIIDIALPGVPWKDRNGVLLWRGTTTGNPSISSTRWGENMRARAVASAQLLGPVLDVGFSGYVQDHDSVGAARLGGARFLDAKTAEGRYRFLLDLDGNSWSSRFGRLLCSGALVFKATRKDSWFTHVFVPWVHYVPLRHDLTDLVQKLEWARAHDSEAQAIAARAVAASSRLLTPEAASTFWREALVGYRDLQTFSVNRPDTPEPLIFSGENSDRTNAIGSSSSDSAHGGGRDNSHNRYRGEYVLLFDLLKVSRCSHIRPPCKNFPWNGHSGGPTRVPWDKKKARANRCSIKLLRRLDETAIAFPTPPRPP